MWSRLKNTKTLKIAAAGILTAFGAYLSEQIELADMIFAMFNGLAVLFLRDGMAKSNGGYVA